MRNQQVSRNWIYLVEFAIKKFLTKDATVGDFIFPLGGKTGTTNFLIVAKSSGLRLKEHCHFLISSEGCRTMINSSGSSFYKNVYKLSTKTVESWKSGPNFLERPPFFGRICRFERVLPRRVECQIQDIITICPEKPTLNCFGNPGNVGMFTTKVYKFVNTSTSLQICSTNVCNCLQRIYMFTKPIQVKLLERILNY
jgi:hypothetical protein